MLITKKRLPLISCLLILLSGISSLSAHSVEQQTILAVLAVNVARFTNWPEQTFNKADPILNLCVFGNNVVQQSFENINKKVVNNKTIHIINLSRLRNIDQCQLLYLAELRQNKLASLLVKLKGQPILTIGENMEFLQAGGMVGLEKINGKIQLTINLPITKQSELVISSRLLKLANIVDFPTPAH